MGRLAGFRYRQVVARLKNHGFVFDVRPLAATRSGSMLRQIDTPPFPIIPATRPILKQAGIHPDDFLRV
jgi:hypothetical protein